MKVRIRSKYARHIGQNVSRMDRHLPKASRRIPSIIDGRRPCIFILIEHALRNHMALARLERRLDNPNPMQFPAKQVGIDSLESIDVVFCFTEETIVIVGNIHFLLAEKLPVIPIKAAVGTENLAAKQSEKSRE